MTKKNKVKTKVLSKGQKTKFTIGQEVITDNGVGTVVTILLTPESATRNGSKIKEVFLYQVRDEEGPNKSLDRTLGEEAIFKSKKSYNKRIEDLEKAELIRLKRKYENK